MAVPETALAICPGNHEPRFVHHPRFLDIYIPKLSAVDRLRCVRASFFKTTTMENTLKLGIEDFREAPDVIGDAAEQEAAIVEQLALDLAATAQFCPNAIEPAGARQLLRLRIARHRAEQQISSIAVH